MAELELPYFPWDCIKIKPIADPFQNNFPSDAFFNLLFVSSGAGILQLNEQNLAFSAPLILCLNERDRISLVTSKNLDCNALHFHPEWINPRFTFAGLREGKAQSGNSQDTQDKHLLNPFLERSANYQGIMPVCPETFVGLRKINEAITQQLTGHPDKFWPCRSRSYLLQALIAIFDLYALQTEMESHPVANAAAKPLPQSSPNRLVEEILAYLHNHYTEEIQIADLEQHFALNRTSLSEKFKAATGQSIMSYLRALRLRTAASLLQETRVPVQEICERVGFNDLSHFGRIFKDEFSVSPKEFRDEYCWVGRA